MRPFDRAKNFFIFTILQIKPRAFGTFVLQYKNPTASQFISAYNKNFTHVSLRDTNHGKCAALEHCYFKLSFYNWEHKLYNSAKYNSLKTIEEEIEVEDTIV